MQAVQITRNGLPALPPSPVKFSEKLGVESVIFVAVEKAVGFVKHAMLLYNNTLTASPFFKVFELNKL